MRCIETPYKPALLLARIKINNNMRCIETYGQGYDGPIDGVINNNMRCI